MGNWRNGPPRRFFNRRRPSNSPPTYSYEKEPSSSGFYEDGIPLWEKKFCYLIGSVPWRKVVETHKFTFGSNILDWDDSAVEEAFQNAKKRYWAEINGFPCDISLPDPDVYIDEINWNPDIDPELIKDLESVYFVPDEGEKDPKVGRHHKRLKYLASVASKRYGENSDIIDRAQECNNGMQGSDTMKVNKSQGCNQWDNHNSDSKNMNNDDNPCHAKVKEQGWSQWDNCNSDSKNMNNDDNPCAAKVKEQSWNQWDNCNNDLKNMNNDDNPCALKVKAQDWNQWDNCNSDSKNMNNDDNPWGSGFTRGNEGSNQWDNINNGSKSVNKGDNPWESALTWGKEAVEDNTWGNGGEKSGGWNEGAKHANQFANRDDGGNAWDQNCWGVEPAKNHKGWDDFRDNSWHGNQQKSWTTNNNGSTHWERNPSQYSRPPKGRGTENYRGSSWGGRKQWDNYNNKEPKNSEHGRNEGWGSGGRNEGWGSWNESRRKREGSHLSSYKSSGYQQDYNQTGHCWRSNKRVSFAP